jgi:signal transduction histidine kinase
VVLQTLAARAALADDGDTAVVDRHLDAVESTAREALGEMRRMLGLLQAGDLDSAPAPSPGLRSLPALVDRAGAAGLHIVATDLPSDAELPSGLELAIFRVVQEALTNAAKHAPGSQVRVGVQVQADAVMVTVVNAAGRTPAHAPEGAGQGLIGMRQRAELYGGSLRTGPTPDGGFEIRATFPLDHAPATAVPHR